MSDWYYAKDGSQTGPIELDALRRLVFSGQVLTTDLVWAEGMPQWLEAGRVPALMPTSAAETPVMPGAAGPLPAALPDGAPQGMPLAIGYGAAGPGSQNPAWGQAGYPVPGNLPYATPMPYLGYATPPAENAKYANLALVGLILTLVAFAVGSVIVGVPGGICGLVALRGMKRTGSTKNRGMAIAAVCIGGFWALAFVVVIVAIAFIIATKK